MLSSPVSYFEDSLIPYDDVAAFSRKLTNWGANSDHVTCDYHKYGVLFSVWNIDYNTHRCHMHLPVPFIFTSYNSLIWYCEDSHNCLCVLFIRIQQNSIRYAANCEFSLQSEEERSAKLTKDVVDGQKALADLAGQHSTLQQELSRVKESEASLNEAMGQLSEVKEKLDERILEMDKDLTDTLGAKSKVEQEKVCFFILELLDSVEPVWSSYVIMD